MNKFKKIFKFMDGYRLLYLLAIIMLLISQALVTLTPIVIQTTIDNVLRNEEIKSSSVEKIIGLVGGPNVLKENLWIVGLIIISITILRGLFAFLKNIFSGIASENTIMSIRNEMYDHIQKLPYDYHLKSETGDLLQRSTSDIETIKRFISIQLLEFIGSSFMLTFVIFTIFSLNTKMAIASIIVLPIIFASSFIFFKKVKSNFTLAEEAEGILSTTLQENLTGVRVVKAFSRQELEIEKFDKANNNFKKLLYKLNTNLAAYWGVSDFVSMFQVGIIVVFGSYLSYKNEISLGTYTAFVTYINMLVWPVRQMGRNLTDMGKAFVSFERIQNILDEPTEIFFENYKEPDIKGKIEFKDVNFGYTHDKNILSNISFSINSGETIALIGPTGSGKSTLVQLLPRLYDYDSGSIKIDGVELKEIDKAWIRKNIGFVLQEPFLYAKTIKENIRLTEPSLKEENVFKAAKIASIHDDISSFDKGYETLVGERGTSLSGGQKQRMAIARTIIKEKPIVVFDDSLSAVDTETDISIRTSLANRKNKSTTIIISHRIATASEADTILVLDKGQIIQRGTHSSLIKEDGLYKKIYNIQNSLVEEI